MVYASPETHDTLSRLAELGLELPTISSGQYSYDTVVTAEGIAFVSGQIPKRDGGVAYTGAVLGAEDIARGQEAAALAALNALAHIEYTVGLIRVKQILKLMVYVASGSDFDNQPAVAEGASQLFISALGNAGRHARTAIGVTRLPKNATVELDVVIALHDDAPTPRA